MDIFEKLKNTLECQYISDLQKEPNKTIAKIKFKLTSIQNVI